MLWLVWERVNCLIVLANEQIEVGNDEIKNRAGIKKEGCANKPLDLMLNLMV